jgi:hypothetical protein
MRMLHHGLDPSRSTEYKVVARSFAASGELRLRSFLNLVTGIDHMMH